MAQLLIEDATPAKCSDRIKIGVRLRGGATRRLEAELPRPSWMERKMPSAAVERIDALVEDHTDSEVAAILNQEGFRTGIGSKFIARHVANARQNYGVKSRFSRLRERGLPAVGEMASRLGVSERTIKNWRRAGLLKGIACNDHNSCLCKPHQNRPQFKSRGKSMPAAKPNDSKTPSGAV